MLELRNLTKRYDQLTVLDRVSLVISEGQFTCLLGRSGCGKTTLIRIVMGLTESDAGTILVDGKPINGPGQDRSIVFQNYGLLPWRNVMSNVEFGLEIRGVPRALRRE